MPAHRNFYKKTVFLLGIFISKHQSRHKLCMRVRTNETAARNTFPHRVRKKANEERKKERQKKSRAAHFKTLTVL